MQNSRPASDGYTGYTSVRQVQCCQASKKEEKKKMKTKMKMKERGEKKKMKRRKSIEAGRKTNERKGKQSEKRSILPV